MKVGIPKDNTEIVTCIMSLFDEMVHLKDDVHKCQIAVVNHADEARHSNTLVNDTVNELKFSVGGLQRHMHEMQISLQHLTELAASLETIGRFIVIVSKCMTWGGGVGLVYIAFVKYIH